MEAPQTNDGQIPLMLIHGAWLSAGSWENYAGYFEEDVAAAYQRYAVPETGQIFYEGGFANFHAPVVSTEHDT